MKTSTLCLAAGLALSLPFAASAQQNTASSAGDVKYCNALAKSYSSMFPVQEGMSVGDVMTLNQCDSNARATITVLEKKLADKKIDLPHDERIAQPPGSTVHTQ